MLNGHVNQGTKYNPNMHLKTSDHIFIEMVGINFGLKYRYWDILSEYRICYWWHCEQSLVIIFRNIQGTVIAEHILR